MMSISCRLCESTKIKNEFRASILNKYDVSYYRCRECDFLQTEFPFWLNEAYSDSINISDTGILQRNLGLGDRISIILGIHFGYKGEYLDYGGGYGIFVRLMRDRGYNFYWSDKYTKNLLARGFEHTHHRIYEAVTSFETFEHFVEPQHELDAIFSLTDTLILTTTLYGDFPPIPSEWHYYGLDHGQHISFYSRKTLEFIARERKLNLYTDNHSFHILSRQKNMYWIFLFAQFLTNLKYRCRNQRRSLTLNDWKTLKKIDH